MTVNIDAKNKTAEVLLGIKSNNSATVKKTRMTPIGVNRIRK